jgi:hypothetical protein
LKKRNIIAFLASIFLIIVLVATGCVINAASLKSTDQANPNSATAATKEKTYNCLNPLGIQPPVTIVPLSPRLTTMDGKTIYIVQGEADPVIFPALYPALQKAYPKAFFNYYQPSSSFGPSSVDTTTTAKATADGTGGANAIVRGNAW